MLVDFSLVNDIPDTQLHSYAEYIFDLAAKDWRFKSASAKQLEDIKQQCAELIFQYIKSAKYIFADVFIHYGILIIDKCMNKQCFYKFVQK